MAGKVTKTEIASAIDAYCTKHGAEQSYDESTDSFQLKDANGLECIFGPGLKCSTQAVFDEIKELIVSMKMDEDGPKSPNLAVRGAGKVSRSPATTTQGSALEAVRGCQATEKPTYSTGDGRWAASAKTNIAALMELGGSIEQIAYVHRPDYIEATYRAILGDRHVDDTMSIYKLEYLAKKAWEWIIKPLMDDPGLVVGTDDLGMPAFREGATIKVRMKDENKNMLVTLPAQIALWRELAREWQSAGRVCQTKAKSRAADQLMRGDWMSREELAEEQSEVRAIHEKESAEA